MTFIAKIDIGGFKKGDVVPEEQASIWMEMYKVSPVEEQVEKPIPKEVSKVEEDIVVEKPKSKSSKKK